MYMCPSTMLPRGEPASTKSAAVAPIGPRGGRKIRCETGPDDVTLYAGATWTGTFVSHGGIMPGATPVAGRRGAAYLSGYLTRGTCDGCPKRHPACDCPSSPRKHEKPRRRARS